MCKKLKTNQICYFLDFFWGGGEDSSNKKCNSLRIFESLFRVLPSNKSINWLNLLSLMLFKGNKTKKALILRKLSILQVRFFGNIWFLLQDFTDGLLEFFKKGKEWIVSYMGLEVFVLKTVIFWPFLNFTFIVCVYFKKGEQVFQVAKVGTSQNGF